ncbi:hypothetical protein AALO_G00216370 [Alosa alosa]|uniref:Spermatogenesis-associated protein 13 n=2 Tax=Alosa alosa TaxID=278164 RepID=A0AAV6G1S3_9TELE|nr:hypothetical protein AALO_G00216370 [Alosa alosa]
MRKAAQVHGASSTLEDPLQCPPQILQGETPGPAPQPLDDLCPFQEVNHRTGSGCVAQVRPVRSEPRGEESRLNGLNSQAWCSPVIGQPEAKPCPSRIMRIFSNQKRCGDATSERTSNLGSAMNPQTWSNLSGLKVMGSFKKLRSSVFQGIQSRGNATTANQDTDYTVITNEDTGCVDLSNGQQPQQMCREGCQSNGVCGGESIFGICSGVPDDNEDEDENDDEFQRNSHFSRSIRRAYGAGRITLLDTGRHARPDAPPKSPKASAPCPSPSRRPRPVSTVFAGSEVHPAGEANSGALSRLSKSAENLHVLKAPFKRKTASAHLAHPRPQRNLEQDLEPQPELGSPERGWTSNIKRTNSASSMDGGGDRRSSGRWRSPSRTRAQMQRLVGSLTDLTSRQRPSSPLSPQQGPPLSPLSRIHDDYSRRTPCVPPSDRQRRPSPARGRAPSEREAAGQRVTAAVVVEHTPSIHPVPLGSSDLTGLTRTDDTSVELHSSALQLANQSLAPLTSSPLSGARSPSNAPAGNSGPVEDRRPGTVSPLQPCLQSSEDKAEDHLQGQLKCIWKTPEKDADEQESDGYTKVADDAAEARALLSRCQSQGESVPSSPATPPPTESPATPTAGTDPPSVAVIRRRSGRSRPRPFSDYAQLVSRKFSIPEERGAETSPASQSETAATATTEPSDVNGSTAADGDGQRSCHGSSPQDHQWRRPMSAIEGMDLFPSPGAEDGEDLDTLPSPMTRPPMPSYQVPPYRAVSARLRPCILSQSTPIGLDRVGRRKLHRVLSDGPSEGCSVLDDSVSEEDGSFDELTDVTPFLQTVELTGLNQLISSGHVLYAEALWDHVTMEEQELAFQAGDVIRVVEASTKDWWCGRVGDREAWFPSSFVRVRVNQEDSSGGSVESVEMALDQETVLPRDKRAQSTEHREQMRTNVVREIMSTERDYIKHLRDICDGYIRQCRKHPGMFTDQQLKTIFSNIEDIYKFQRKFLKDLERKYNKEEPHLSEIGSCFLQQGDGFSIYSDYCNTHPVACTELQRLMKLSRYKHFFEACRLLQQMIDISLAGFLLTPVQKICKYPLQLGELLKYTPKDHSDFRGVSDAYEAMKNVASLINERKRRLESIDTIAQWQVSILRWEGEDVLACSSELIHSGELTRVVRNGKTQQRSFFLFDHQLVFCKKDVLRRDLLHYRGRLEMDAAELQDLPDGRDAELGGVSLRNAFRLRSTETQETLCTLCCRRAEDKRRWLEAFARERRRVQEDQEMGMEISEEQWKQAILNAQKAKQGKIKSMGYSGHPVPTQYQPLHPLHQRHVTVPTSVPQQQVFALAEPKRKPAQLWHSITRHALFKK